jgi:repressor LexA
MQLPPGQKRVLSIFANAEDEGRQISRAEVAEACGYAFPSAVTKHVDALVRKGLLMTDPTKKRSVRITASGWESLDRSPTGEGVPIIGAIAAGLPILASENHDGYLEEVAPRPGRFALRVRGDSMTGVGIEDGDYAVIDSRRRLRHGQIGAVIVDDEATLKRVRFTRTGVTLVAENPRYQNRTVRKGSGTEVRIIGPLALVIRRVP